MAAFSYIQTEFVRDKIISRTAHEISMGFVMDLEP